MAARGKAGVPRDNVRSLDIAGEGFTFEASLGTSIIYSDEFMGRLEEPYRGLLDYDMLQVWNKASVTTDADGDRPPAEVREVRHIDTRALIRLAWAMARAAESTDMGYEDFHSHVAHLPAGRYDEAALFEVAVLELGSGIIFRHREGQAGPQEADEA